MTGAQTLAQLELPADLAREVQAALDTIVELAHPLLVILFGSYAAGHAREDSDLDLLVVVDTPQPRKLSARLHLALLDVLGDREFDLLLRTPAEWEDGRRIIGFVSREADLRGMRLYERAA
jgi:predicted nucleotidyltransferase